jgi:endonuclease/exonuclease/phosphatase family metal-dependent hydrolase
LDAPAAAVDLRAVHVHDDSEWLYMAVDWAREVNAQAMRGSVKLLFDADGDDSTGAVVHDMAGVDAILELSRRDDPQSDEYGSGAGIRPVVDAGPQSLESSYLVGLIVGPTVAAPRIELRLRRGASIPGVPALWTAARTTIKALFEDAGGVADETSAVEFAFTTDHIDGSRTPSLAEASAASRVDDTTRVLVWNVAERGHVDATDAFQRVLNALDPDVVLLDEVYEHSTVEGIEALLNEPAPLHATPWQVVLGLGGGRQKTVVATRLPIRPEPDLARIDYRPDALDDLDQRRPGFEAIIQTERDAGLAATGAWVTVSGSEVLFVPFDLQSGGYAGSIRDALRRLQAGHLSETVASVLRESGRSTVILGGDANAVGSARPLELLQQAGHPSSPLLTMADARHPGTDAVYTWRNGGGRFPPGRLDYLFFGGAGLELVRAFPFEPEDFTDAALAALAVEREDARRVSDHLPLVGDFRFGPAR